DLVAGGAIGTVTGVSYRLTGPQQLDVAARARDGEPLPWRVQAEHAGGGLFLDLGCHTLDILDFIVGPLADVHGSAANLATPLDVEAAVAMTSRTPGGAPGTAQWSFASAQRDDTIAVTGTRGEVRLSTFGNEPVELRRGDAVETFDLPNPRHIQQPFIQTIV